MKTSSWITLSLLLHLALGSALWVWTQETSHTLPTEVIDLTLTEPMGGGENSPKTPPTSSSRKAPPTSPHITPGANKKSPALPQEESSGTKEGTPQDTLSSEGAGAGSDNTPVGWGDVTRFPKVLKEVKATYPEEAKKAGVDGPVILEILIDRQGKVRDVKVIQGPGFGLNESALEAIKKFEFQPALKGTDSVAVKIRYTYRFKLGVN